MVKIFLFRHGQTTDNKIGRFSGWSDPDLTEEGITEAKTIGEALKNELVTKAYSSDLIRSQHTLSLVLHPYHPPLPIIIDPRIKERDYGDLTGKIKAEVEKEYPTEYAQWHRSYETPPPHGESIQMVEKRVFSFIADMIPTFKPNDVVFLSAHGNSLRPIRKYFERLNNKDMCSFEHTPGKIYQYTL